MPAADLAMQRKVPTRLIWMMRSKAAMGKCLIAPVALSRLAVLIALPVPAQLTSTRSWPIAARACGEAGVHLLFAGNVDLAEHAAQFLGQRLAGGFVEVEQRHLDAVLGEAPRGGGAETGGAAGDDGRDVRGEFHGRSLYRRRRPHRRRQTRRPAFGLASGRPGRAGHRRAARAQPRRPGAGRRRDHGLRAPGRRAERLHRPHGGPGLEAAAGRAGRDHRPAMRFVAAGGALRRPGGDVRHDGLRHRRGRGKHVAHSDDGAAQGLQGSRTGALHEPHDPRALPRSRVQPVHGRGNDGREVPAVQGRARLLLPPEPSARRGGHAGRRVHGRDRAGGGTHGRGSRPSMRCTWRTKASARTPRSKALPA